MSKKDDGGAAFPHTRKERNYGVSPGILYEDVRYEGMTLRDWFAGQTAASISGALTASGHATAPQDAVMVAKASYTLADAMLAARKGGEA